MNKQDRPNILIFMTDQQQAQVTMPDHPCRTPHLDGMARRGVRFANCFTTMTHCCPSRASFMTGRYPSRHGVYNNVCNEAAINKGLHAGIETFAEKLKSAGYGLHFSGKWHVSAVENPADRGWDELTVTAHKDAYMGRSIEQWRDGPAVEDPGDRQPGSLRRNGWGPFQLFGTLPHKLEETDDYAVVSQAVERLHILESHQEPWCMYVGTFGPHDPFIVPEPYASMYDPSTVELPPNYHDSLEHKPNAYKRMRRVWGQLSEKEVKQSIAHYWGYCTMVDDLLGMMLDALDETGQADNTMVVFLSDHGESLGAHGLFLKGISPYDETYRIPCVIRWPEGLVRPGRDHDSLISMMDFAPTFLELAGLEVPADWNGRSLLPWLRDQQPEQWRDAVYTQCNGVEVYYSQRIVRTEEYKLVYNPTDIDELYDLHEDPYELHNVAEHEDYRELKHELFVKMWQEAAVSRDILFNHYPTVAMADTGPAGALGKPS